MQVPDRHFREGLVRVEEAAALHTALQVGETGEMNRRATRPRCGGTACVTRTAEQ